MESTIEIKASTLHGRGVFARQKLKKNSYLGTFEGPEAKRNSSHVLWVHDPETGKDTGRLGKNMLRFLNHSSNPNAEFDLWDLHALRDISEGEEITIDYGFEH